MCVRERQRQTNRDRQTDRQTDRQVRHTERDRARDRQTETDREVNKMRTMSHATKQLLSSHVYTSLTIDYCPLNQLFQQWNVYGLWGYYDGIITTSKRPVISNVYHPCRCHRQRF